MGAVHEVYAVKFGVNTHGTRGHYLLGDAGRPADEPMQLDYLVFVIRTADGDIVLDAGWTAETNKGRPRILLEDPGVALRRVGTDPTAVRHVVLSHFHNDHVGDLEAFPQAQFVAQRAEFEFWTSPIAWRRELARHAERSDVERLEALHRGGRLTLVDGDLDLADGVRLVLLGGHTPGSQVIVVDTARGPVVLAGDAAHYFEEVEQDHPFAIFTDLPGLYAGFERMRELAVGGLVVPGHDPLVLERFESVPGHEGRAVRVA